MIINIAKNFASQDVLRNLEASRTVEHLIQLSKGQGIQEKLFNAVSSEILKAVSNYIKHEVEVKVLLADFNGNLIGQAPTGKK